MRLDAQQLLPSLILSVTVWISGRLNRPGTIGHVARGSAARNVRPIYILLGKSKIYIFMKE
jgi:hypothetical protein